MNDPLGAFDDIRDSFLLYLRTAFGTQFSSVERHRTRLLKQPGAFHQEPWLEPIPRFRSSGKRITDLDRNDAPGLSEDERKELGAFALCGLLGDFELHMHQLRMM